MAKGDHLVISLGVYQHHAIDLGDGTIVQYGSGDLKFNRVEVVPLDSLASRQNVRIENRPAQYSPDEIVERALGRIDEENYDLFGNNCEHFVTWCRTGEATSRQVERVIERTASAAAKMFARQGTRVSGKLGTRILSKRIVKTATPWLLAADAAQLSAEVLSSHHGASDDQAEKVGQAVGLSASIGIGAIAAGPLGAIAGIGFWAIGEVAGKMATG